MRVETGLVLILPLGGIYIMISNSLLTTKGLLSAVPDNLHQDTEPSLLTKRLSHTEVVECGQINGRSHCSLDLNCAPRQPVKVL